MLDFKLARNNIGLLVIADSLLYISNMGFANALFTPISLAAKFIALGYLIYVAQKSNWNTQIANAESIVFKLFFAWNLITIVRGAFGAVDYWDWRFLFLYSSLFLLIPLAFFFGRNLNLARLTFFYIANYLFKYGFIFIPLTLATNPELYSRLMIPISFFIVFFPYLKKEHRILVILVAITSILMIIGFRTNIIKIMISVLVVISWYFRRFVSIGWFKLVHLVLFILPVVLLSLAITGSYNIFAQTSENNTGYRIKGNTGEEESFAADTRTFLYVEVFATLKKNGSWLMGEGGVGKYQSDYFDYLGDNRGRYGSEVGFLNTLLYSGFIGVLLYGSILFLASYYGIYRSRNWLCKMMGIIIASRWLLYFLEEFTQFDMNFYIVWIIIGLISSTAFRAMTDKELSRFFRLSRE